jgi:hypothetical protein
MWSHGFRTSFIESLAVLLSVANAAIHEGTQQQTNGKDLERQCGYFMKEPNDRRRERTFTRPATTCLTPVGTHLWQEQTDLAVSVRRPGRQVTPGGQDAVGVEAALEAPHELPVAVGRRVQPLHPVDGHPRRRVARG